MNAAAKISGTSTMRSPINWSLLAIVIDRPSYGYELQLRFERVYDDVLSISGAAHIYKALDMLESRELIEVTPGKGPIDVVPGRRRQPRLHYRATAKGVTHYDAWLLAQTRDDRRRSQLFVRQLALYDPSAALRLIERYEQECLKEVAKTSADSAVALHGEHALGLAERLGREENRLALEGRLAWIQYARREFEALVRSRIPPP